MKTQTMTIPTLITEMEPTSRTVEAYQELSINLRFAMLETNLKTLAITSASEGEGKSTITANLGILFAQSGQRVLLVDGNLRHPFLHRLFALENQVGWGNLLNGQVTNLQEIISPTRVINLFLLPSGV
ncbi:CpsD/CapB family tyrosine-protein kinase, partial [Enterococcus thailandicus]